MFFYTSEITECELLRIAAVKRPSHSMLETLEHAAAELARHAGSHIVSVPHDRLDVQLKQAPPGMAANANPVSNVDREVEHAMRQKIGAQFPEHVVIGEETQVDDESDRESPFVWVIDPIDGTTNYLNGLPLYCSSIGVLFMNFPVAGAVWCASTHALKPGVYHAHEDGPLRFDGATLASRIAGHWRGLASEPGAPAHYGAFFDTRVLASAALECAFTSAGLLRLAYLSRPAVWDVAAGIVLARAAGCDVLTRRHHTWTPFAGFTAPNARRRLSSLRSWRQPVLIGDRRAVAREAAVDTAIE
jgi:myo-inositol-1(or 4)-monophosphatase